MLVSRGTLAKRCDITCSASTCHIAYDTFILLGRPKVMSNSHVLSFAHAHPHACSLTCFSDHHTGPLQHCSIHPQSSTATSLLMALPDSCFDIISDHRPWLPSRSCSRRRLIKTPSTAAHKWACCLTKHGQHSHQQCPSRSQCRG